MHCKANNENTVYAFPVMSHKHRVKMKKDESIGQVIYWNPLRPLCCMTIKFSGNELETGKVIANTFDSSEQTFLENLRGNFIFSSEPLANILK